MGQDRKEQPRQSSRQAVLDAQMLAELIQPWVEASISSCAESEIHSLCVGPPAHCTVRKEPPTTSQITPKRWAVRVLTCQTHPGTTPVPFPPCAIGRKNQARVGAASSSRGCQKCNMELTLGL